MTLTFININTGKINRYERSECPDWIVQMVKDELKRSGSLWKGWSVIVRHSSPEYAQFDLKLDDVPITHCWLCRSYRAISTVWQKIIDVRAPIMAVSRPPEAVPWLAISMASGSISVVMSRPERLPEAPAVEISMAWALME